jgi:hypothetical protein
VRLKVCTSLVSYQFWYSDMETVNAKLGPAYSRSDAAALTTSPEKGFDSFEKYTIESTAELGHVKVLANGKNA